MPIIKIGHIVSCSSEDPNHPAVNLTSADNRTWKCKNAGEKQACVVLQLEREAVLTSVDIGNENSAFIEVLVGRSSSPDVDFEVLLVASSFMSPMEARSGSSANRVRMFAMDKLSKPAAEQKWDRVKVVCTQPFNKHVQYGLAFITFHSVMTDDKPAASSNKLGRFVVKDDSDEADCLRAGSLFARRKDVETQPLKAGAAAIREASSPAAVMKYGLVDVAATQTASPATVRKHRPVNVAATEASSPAAVTKHRPVNVAATETSSPAAVTKHKPMQRAETVPQKQEACHKNGTQKAKGREQCNLKPKKKEVPVVKKPRLLGKPFGKLLEGVVLVISGYQNPHRANLRTMALEMGASYKSDWGSSCTHLVCAFPNTPKFQQVWGKGHVVCKEWIENCHRERKRLPWRRFALDKRDHNKPESEDEIHELLQDVPGAFPHQDPGEMSEVDEQPQSGSDTENEIMRVRTANPYDEDTDMDSDEERPSTANMPLPQLPNFFNGRCFHLHKELNADVRSKLKRYITAFSGSLMDQFDDPRVNFVISDKKVRSKQPVVMPDWVWACSDAGVLLSTKPYQFA